jgi:alkylhydroperoxidase/carboxymuconolactone decarboxylase family protein YurZ
MDPASERFASDVDQDLDQKTRSLACVAAFVALGASAETYVRAVEAAVASGASRDEIIGVLYAVAPAVGIARVVTAAPRLAAAMGYDVDRAIEYLTTNGTDGTGSP